MSGELRKDLPSKGLRMIISAFRTVLIDFANKIPSLAIYNSITYFSENFIHFSLHVAEFPSLFISTVHRFPAELMTTLGRLISSVHPPEDVMTTRCLFFVGRHETAGQINLTYCC
jgi:hypothetical protein